MTITDMLDNVMAIAREAVAGDLLTDIDSLSTTVRAVGWIPEVEGGRWSMPGAPAWALLSSDHAPNLAVFFQDDDSGPVFTAAQELARRLDGESGVRRRVDSPEWPEWPPQDPRWATWDGLSADWVTWEGGPAVLSLNVRPALQPGRFRVPPSLHFQIERIDTPAEGLPDDDDLDRHIAG